MSVSGLSPRPYAGSFSAGAATRPRAASPALGAVASSYNSILLDECSIRPVSHRLFDQAKKIKEARAKEELRAKVMLTYCGLCKLDTRSTEHSE